MRTLVHVSHVQKVSATSHLRLGIHHFLYLHTEAVMELAMQQSWPVNIPLGKTLQDH